MKLKEYRKITQDIMYLVVLLDIWVILMHIKLVFKMNLSIMHIKMVF
jgi:hypothetical protein